MTDIFDQLVIPEEGQRFIGPVIVEVFLKK